MSLVNDVFLSLENVNRNLCKGYEPILQNL